MRVTAERATVGFCAAPEGAQDSYEGSVPSTPPPQFAQKTREPGPAACWAKLSRPAARDGTIVAEAAWRALAFQTAASSSLKSGTGALSPTQRAERTSRGLLVTCTLYSAPIFSACALGSRAIPAQRRSPRCHVCYRRPALLQPHRDCSVCCQRPRLRALPLGTIGDRGKGCS